jgi:RNA polymerase sigma factor (sigma-70 family)
VTQTEAWFDRLYARHRAVITAYCARRIGVDDAQDAASQVFAVAWQKRSQMPRGDKELPWLYGVARNVVSHHRRHAGRVRRLADKARTIVPAGRPGPEAIVVERAEYAAVRSAIARLSPDDQEVLLLSAWEGLSHRDIALALGCSQAAVDKRIVRARARLARQYEVVERSRLLPPVKTQKGGGGT